MTSATELAGVFFNLHRECNRGLVILDSRKCPRLVGRDGGVAGNDDTEYIALHGDTEREGSNVEEEHVLSLLAGLASENRSLNCSTVCNSLIRVDGLVELTAVEELADERLNLRNTGGTTDEHDIINLEWQSSVHEFHLVITKSKPCREGFWNLSRPSQQARE